MFMVGDTAYPLCLLDTMAVSEMVKRPKSALRNFYAWADESEPCFVPCFSPFTFIELRRKPDLFQQFIQQFDVLPCVMLKGYEQFLEEEAERYPDPSSLDPCGLAFTPLGGEGNRLANLPTILRTPSLQQQEQHWNRVGPEIVEGMVSLVPNFPPDGDRYTDEKLQEFIELAGWSQLAMRAGAFIKQALSRGEAIEIDAFPSLKAMLYVVFHKFYVDTERKPLDSDAFDVIISSALPYVEAVITESHLAEALSKTKRRDGFISELEVFTLRDFR